MGKGPVDGEIDPRKVFLKGSRSVETSTPAEPRKSSQLSFIEDGSAKIAVSRVPQPSGRLFKLDASHIYRLKKRFLRYMTSRIITVQFVVESWS